jgi:hypothetical protein
MPLRRTLFCAALCALLGCETAVDDDDAVGTLSGSFTCQITGDDATAFDLGAAHFEGDIRHTGYIGSLRTQGCFARTIEAERGFVVQVRLLQHIDWDVAQVLELNLPIGVEGTDRLLQPGDVVEISDERGFGSVYWVDGAGAEPGPLFLRTLSGSILVEEPAELGGDDWFSGTFDNLLMGDL